jgi:methionyl-tRNA formyltransferase
MRIIYLGTPEFAVAPLDHLVKKGYNVVAVVTAPDKPAGRGKKLTPPPVKVYAESRNIPVLQPLKLKDEDFIQRVQKLNPGIQVVVAFRMMPRELWSIPEKGTFNLHASLLPQYRGAAPINRAIINGESMTGLTTFFIDDKIDTGEIIFREKMEIGENETAGELHDRMMITGAELVVKTVKAIEEGSVRTQPQPDLEKGQNELKAAPKIFREDCIIDWTKDAKSIHNLIRGLSPYPTAFTYLQKDDEEKIQLKIYESGYEISSQNQIPGGVFTDGKKTFKVSTPDGYINIKSLQVPGKRKMNTAEFLNGFKGIERYRLM